MKFTIAKAITLSLFVGTPLFAANDFSDIPTDLSVANLFSNRDAAAKFVTESGSEVDAPFELRGQNGNFRRNGSWARDELTNIKYLTGNQAKGLANEGLEGLYPSAFGNCNYVIAAKWQTRGNRSSGRVVWCANDNSSGQTVEGVYWANEENIDWSNPIFTGTWNGTWK